MESLASHINAFNRRLDIACRLPDGISVMNPYRDYGHVLHCTDAFYKRFYSDRHPRRLILGINPGRLGAGQTGIPFTDPKRLWTHFQLGSPFELTHEASAAFVYQMIDAYGGVNEFYSRFLVSSICPLGFVQDKNGKQVNYNYYDSRELQQTVTPFIIQCMEEQLTWPMDRSVVYCLGTGKNMHVLQQLNEEHQWFERIVPLEHPRYIMQYKSSRVEEYILKYLKAFSAME